MEQLLLHPHPLFGFLFVFIQGDHLKQHRGEKRVRDRDTVDSPSNTTDPLLKQRPDVLFVWNQVKGNMQTLFTGTGLS